MSTTRRDEWREQLKAKRKAAAAERRDKLAADPRVQAMKEALRQRRRAAYDAAKARRKQRDDERKKRRAERVADERARRDDELMAHVARATRSDHSEDP